jgi:glycosyltransferase involved in cell wall biosynthesis
MTELKLDEKPLISVIVPVYNGSKHIGQCLDSLRASSYENYEIIVVDDASTDDTPDILKEKKVIVLRLSERSGPATARNHGAQIAKGEILLFIDSDILVKQDTISRVASDFTNNQGIVAVFGSYDDAPAPPDFLSQFRNLFHHFTHQDSNEEAKTFWAGCGAVNREVYFQSGGFNAHRYTRASIEDIELGISLAKMGHRILLDKELQVKHLKHWSWLNWLRSDVIHRAVPWSRLTLELGSIPQDLNLKTSHRISAFLVGLLLLIVALLSLNALNFLNTGFNRILITLALIICITIAILNRKLYWFFLQKRGFKFMILSIPTHWLYYLYSGLTFTVCWILHKISVFRNGAKIDNLK